MSIRATAGRTASASRQFLGLPWSAKVLCLKGGPLPAGDALPAEAAIDEAIDWLRRAQDHSLSQDGGVARHYSLLDGWGPSYPETTGYIVPTMLDYAERRGDDGARRRAHRMLDWLVSIQFPEGGFQGGVIGAEPRVPVTFNTGQILLGLARGARECAEYLEPMRRAAEWLVAAQDGDGCWRRHPTPFAAPGEKTYDTHVAWGLLEAARTAAEPRYAAAALANVRWALGRQQANGWLAQCCLDDPRQPLTHTLGYALRGMVEAYRYSGDTELGYACRRTADGLLGAMSDDGHLAGRLRADWRAAVRWSCLTGTAQIAICWWLLGDGDERYRRAARIATDHVRRSIDARGGAGVRGGVAGSRPLYGAYGRYQYLAWAAKFFIDAQALVMGDTASVCA